jgi:hypothetical protein
MSAEVDGDLAQVTERELALLVPAVRRDPDRVRAFLHREFMEFGASGRVWDRTSIAAITERRHEPITATDMTARRLDTDTVLLTYRSHAPDRQSLRSSLWVREAGDWLLLFHQGTPVD